VDFIAINGASIGVKLPVGAEIAVKRSLFDDLLLARARELGAEVHERVTVTGLAQDAAGMWTIQTEGQSFTGRVLVGADGRNSTVARLSNFLPRAGRERVALQTHVPLPPSFGPRVVLQFRPEGYSGQAPVGPNELNLCLVAAPARIASLKNWATEKFNVPDNHPWRTITPLMRHPLAPAQRNLFFIGDAARVVEPFTGEGIFYALASGELAAHAATRLMRNENPAGVAKEFSAAHETLYRGRLWINRLARAAVRSPRIGSIFVHAARRQPALLRLLTSKIVN
jgi:flavin-dependent dehydrogenase